MSLIIDAHVHAFPDPLQGRLNEKAKWARIAAKSFSDPLSAQIHKAQPLTRFFPSPLRRIFDQAGILWSLPHLALESTFDDLKETMNENEVNYAAVIAHLPLLQSETVLKEAKKDDRFLPVVVIPPDEKKPNLLLKKWQKQGAKALKIHAAVEGESPDSERYKELLRAASDLGLPVILHTGCLHLWPLYKNPHFGEVELFQKWFKGYPKTQFILAHMNFHFPDRALKICEKNANVVVDTSWQPTEVIAQAVNRIGSERVLYASDWPLMGGNISISLERVRAAHRTELITKDDEEKILGLNAAKLFQISA